MTALRNAWVDLVESKILVIINEVLSSAVVSLVLHLHTAGFVLLPLHAAAASCSWATHGARNVFKLFFSRTLKAA